MAGAMRANHAATIFDRAYHHTSHTFHVQHTERANSKLRVHIIIIITSAQIV